MIGRQEGRQKGERKLGNTGQSSLHTSEHLSLTSLPAMLNQTWQLFNFPKLNLISICLPLAETTQLSPQLCKRLAPPPSPPLWHFGMNIDTKPSILLQMLLVKVCCEISKYFDFERLKKGSKKGKKTSIGENTVKKWFLWMDWKNYSIGIIRDYIQ